MPDASTPLDASLTIAQDHVAWAHQQGQEPAEILILIGEEAPHHANWDYVVGRVAAAWRRL